MIPNNSIRPLELVVSAIHCLREKKGSSPRNIVRFLQNKYNIHSGVIKPHVQTGLKRGLSFGLITFSSGLYRLNNALGQIPGRPDLASGDTNTIKPRQNRKTKKRRLTKQSIRARTGMKRIRALHTRKRTKGRKGRKQKKRHVFLGEEARCNRTKRPKDKEKTVEMEAVKGVKSEKAETEAGKRPETEHPSVSTKEEEKGTPS